MTQKQINFRRYVKIMRRQDKNWGKKNNVRY